MGRIALCGVFDIPNYGDHLFPLVLREELSRRGYAGNVVLFSPFQAEESFVENSNVHSLDDLERMHMEEPFSAIVVGEGRLSTGIALGKNAPSTVPTLRLILWIRSGSSLAS